MGLAAGKKNPDRVPHVLKYQPLEVCCFCGANHTSGIYIREERGNVPFCKCKDADL